MFVFVLFVLSQIASISSADVCDKVYHSVSIGRIEGNETPSPIEVNMCYNQIQDVNFECKFDMSICEESCRITGYETDQFGCPINCNCKSSGFLEEDIKFEQNDVIMLQKNYGVIPPEVADAASVGFFRWDRIKEDGRIKVPYVIDSSMSIRARTAIELAMSDYSNLTCIDFVQNSKHDSTDYIAFVAKGGCWSYVGRRGGRQEISIGYGCEWKGVVQHEIMHALGFWHEQSRPDRDDHVIVHYENVIEGKTHNFNKRTSIFSFDSPYDLKSIMHYGGYAFSKNQQPTITVKASEHPIISQRSGFSEEDIAQINAMYQCQSTLTTTTTATTSASVVSPSWSKWGAWSACSVTCSGGSQTRERLCQTQNGSAASGCYGLSNSTQKCETKECETTTPPTTTESTTVAGRWSTWSNWGSCSKSCGPGYQWRFRKCVGGNAGEGGCSSGSTWSGKRCFTRPCFEGSLFNGNALTEKSWSCSYGEYLYGDFNGDGGTDVICYYSSDWIRLFFADESGTFSDLAWSGYSDLCKDLSKPTSVVTGDFNGDKNDDLLCQGKNGQIRVNFFTNSRFSNKVDLIDQYEDFCTEDDDKLNTYDVDGDGLSDLVCGTTRGFTEVMLNTFA